MSDGEFGYVGRVRECGCAVFVCVDEPEHANEIAEALHNGLYLERVPITEIRGALKFGCEHRREPMRPGGYKLWRVECWYIVAAPNEEEALRIEVDRFDLREATRVMRVDPSTIDDGEAVYICEWGAEDDGLTLARWLASEPTDAERERMNRITLEAQGQARLAL